MPNSAGLTTLGLLLLVVCLFLDFSGYVLRWDEGIRWALVAGTNLVRSIPVLGPGLYGFLMGGSQPGPASLVRFFGWHVFGLTLVLVFVGAWHLFRVRRDGGIAVAPPELRQDSRRITRYELVRREALAAILGGAVLVVLALVRPAPISPPIQENLAVTADGRPWFSMGAATPATGRPIPVGRVSPLVILAWLAILPLWLPKPNRLN
jgi:quinol-cytochrome oxidoreductase complex cytochrome b subunit